MTRSDPRSELSRPNLNLAVTGLAAVGPTGGRGDPGEVGGRRIVVLAVERATAQSGQALVVAVIHVAPRSLASHVVVCVRLAGRDGIGWKCSK